jgi:hypothetical protein
MKKKLKKSKILSCNPFSRKYWMEKIYKIILKRKMMEEKGNMTSKKDSMGGFY